MVKKQLNRLDYWILSKKFFLIRFKRERSVVQELSTAFLKHQIQVWNENGDFSKTRDG